MTPPRRDGQTNATGALPPDSRAIEVGGDNIGITSTGPNALNVQAVYQAPVVTPMEEIDAPAGLGSVPVVPEVFVGREGDLQRVERAMAASPGSVVVTAVHGLGGVGKSTLAARYAAVHRSEYTLVWWITADTPTAIETGLARLAVALQPTTAGVPLEQQTEHGLRWLASHPGWLLILDNLDAPTDASTLLERMPHAHVLITSRRAANWHTTGTALPLDVLDSDDAVDMLTQIITGTHPGTDCDGAEGLCAELGYLPLAIEQAAAYIAQADITPADYQNLLKRYPATMFAETAEGGDAQRTMARIWRVTLDRLADTPAAGQILRMLAWFAPDDIPRALLTGIVSEPLLLRAIGRLSAYSMITTRGDQISMHRLVQAVTRTPATDDLHRTVYNIAAGLTQATNALARIVIGLDPFDPALWATYGALVPHMRALTINSNADRDSDSTVRVLLQFGRFLHEQGQLAEATAYFHRGVTSSERVLGADHRTTLASRSSLAYAYRTAGDLKRAIPLFEAVLADTERLLGANHPDTLISRNNLASTYETAGDLKRAIPLFEAVLADTERLLGANHPDTLTSRNNLAGAYDTAGDLKRAIPLYEATLADRERVLGANHPSTLTSRNNLAYAYQTAGDLKRAVPLFEAAVADRGRVLGANHPSTLSSRNNLAGAYKAAGDPKRAIPLYEAILVDYERVLGANHPDTLNCRNNLASAYQAGGDPKRAIPLYEAILADRERLLGANHPDTLISRNNLAGAYHAAGDLKRAIPLFEAALADYERVLGANHPHTLTSRNNLAGAYKMTGDLKRAIPLFEGVLADRERLMGANHPDTLTSRNNLATAYKTAGDPKRAIPLYEAALVGCERVLGVEHPTTDIVRRNLRYARGNGDTS